MSGSRREIDLAWVGGFFSGEGTTCATNAKRGNFFGLTITNTNREALEFCNNVLGAGIIHNRRKYSYSRLSQKKIYVYVITRWRDALMALRELWPFLSEEKRKQARRAINKFMKRKILKGIPNVNGKFDVCKWGHRFTDETTYISPRGAKECKVCREWRRPIKTEHYEWLRKKYPKIGSDRNDVRLAEADKIFFGIPATIKTSKGT